MWVWGRNCAAGSPRIELHFVMGKKTMLPFHRRCSLGLGVLLIACVSCVTPPKTKEQDILDKVPAKKSSSEKITTKTAAGGKKTPVRNGVSTSAPASGAGNLGAKAERPDLELLESLYKAFPQMAPSKLLAHERAYWRSLQQKKPPTTKLEEAVLLLGVLDNFEELASISIKEFDEKDITPAPATAAPAATEASNAPNLGDKERKRRIRTELRVLENTAREYGIDLGIAFHYNNFLQKPEIFLRLKEYQEVLRDDAAPNKQHAWLDVVRQTVDKVKEDWDHVALEWNQLPLPVDSGAGTTKQQAAGVRIVPLAPAAQPTVPAITPLAPAGEGSTSATAESAAATAAGEQTAPLDVAKGTSAVSLQNEDTFNKAQLNIQKGHYKEALEQFAVFKEDSPLYTSAQEKIQEVSNAASTQLRRDAAKEFQNASAVADKKARLAYLQKAKSYLEMALKDYPLSSHKDTIEKNLEVIKGQISQIQ